MSKNSIIPWDSRSLVDWAQKYARGKFVKLNGRLTHYIEKGTGEALILVHGFFYDHHTWHRNIEYLARHFKVYALDLWGFGYSTREVLDYGYPLFAEQIMLFLDHFKINKASFMGHSMGGGTLIYFAVNHAELVDKLVLVDATGIRNPLPLLGQITNLPFVGEWMFHHNSNFTRKLALKQNWFYAAKYIAQKYFEDVTRFHKIEGSSKVMLKILRKRFFDKITKEVEALGKLNKDILIIWGRHDTAVPMKCGMKMHQLLPGSKFEIIEDVGHCPHDETADQFNRISTAFLNT